MQTRGARRAAGSTASTFRPATSPTIGGNVATNAGGLRVLRYGDTRRQLTGRRVRDRCGRRDHRSLSGTLRDNTGYHLPSLVCGSEGTLGVVHACALATGARTSRERARRCCASPSAATRLRRRRVAAAAAADGRVDRVVLRRRRAHRVRRLRHRAAVHDLAGGYVLVEAADVLDPTPQLARGRRVTRRRRRRRRRH